MKYRHLMGGNDQRVKAARQKIALGELRDAVLLLAEATEQLQQRVNRIEKLDGMDKVRYFLTGKLPPILEVSAVRQYREELEEARS